MNRPLSELAEIIRLDKGAHKTPQQGVCVNGTDRLDRRGETQRSSGVRQPRARRS
jgi:hypothetical protein